MNTTAYISLILAVVIGSALGVYLSRKTSKQYLSFILPFSGAFLLGVSILHMLPELFYQSSGEHILGVYILIGFLIQITLEMFSKGVEHGHVHGKKGQNKGYLISIMFGLCAHAFLEGMPIDGLNEAHVGHVHNSFQQPYLWGIVAHKLPAATALSILLLASNVNRVAMFVYIGIFALMSPLGAITANVLNMNTSFEKIILALAVGSILHIATIIIFETEENAHHKISLKKLIAVLLGFGIALFSLL